MEHRSAQNLNNRYNVWGRYVLRPLSKPVARAAFVLGLQANHITVGGFAIGLVGCALLAKGHPVVGLVLVNAWALLDYVDGQVARLRGGETSYGRFLDNIADTAIVCLLFVSIGVEQVRVHDKWFYLAVGSIIPTIRLYSVVVGYNFWQAIGTHPNEKLQSSGRYNKFLMTTGVSLENITGIIMPAALVATVFGALDVVLWVWLAIALVSASFVLSQAIKRVRHAQTS